MYGKFSRTQQDPFVYLFSMVAFILQQTLIVATKTLTANLTYFHSGLYKNMFTFFVYSPPLKSYLS